MVAKNLVDDFIVNISQIFSMVVNLDQNFLQNFIAILDKVLPFALRKLSFTLTLKCPGESIFSS